MSGFNNRLARGVEFEREVEAYCQTHSIAVARNGTEHTHPDFVAQLRSRNDEQSKFIRFAPDGVCLIESAGVIHWEAKYSNNLEKDAYETYLKYSDMGCKVYIFFKHPKTYEVYSSEVLSIGFVPSESVVSVYPVARRHPICEEDWIWPRLGFGHKSSAASGTPYREVDFQSLKHITDFYARINDVMEVSYQVV